MQTSVRALLFAALAWCAMHSPHASTQAYGTAGQQVAVKKSQTIAPYGYWEYLPSNYSETSGEKFGLMIFLHGAGEKGNGETTLNSLTDGGGWPTNLIAKSGKTYPVIVLSPQCSEPGPTPPAHQPCSWWNQARLVEFARYAIQRYAVDKGRVYVTGLSMGGAGTLFLARGMPNEIAAAIPICAAEGANAAQDIGLRRMPMWVTHANDDTVVGIGNSKSFINSITVEADDIFAGYDFAEPSSDQVATYRLSTQTHAWQKATSYNLIDSDARLRFTVYRTGNHGIWGRTYADNNIMNWLFTQRLKPVAMDLSGDGRSEIVLQYPDGTAYALLAPNVVDNRVEFTTVNTILPPDSGWSVAFTGDFNGDNKADLILKHTSGALFTYLMDGINVVGGGFLLGGGSNWSISHVADLNGDGKSDVIFKNTDGSVYTYLMNGASVLSSGFLLGANTGWRVNQVADTDGDGKADLILEHTNGTAYMYQMNGTAVAAGGFLLAANTNWRVINTGDLNGDGKADLLLQYQNTIADNNNGAIYAYIMNGLDVASGAPLFGGLTGFTLALVGDINGDGKADLVLENNNGTLHIYLMNGTAIASGGAVLLNANTIALHLLDFNGDGRLELVGRDPRRGDTIGWYLRDGASPIFGIPLALGSSIKMVPPQRQ